MRRPKNAEPGLTLIEILVAMAVFAMTGVLVYGSLAGSMRAQETVEAAQARTREVRVALLRMTRELQSAFIVRNANQFTTEGLRAETLFLGREEGGFHRLDFTSFSHERTQANVNESDQCELSYFVRRSKDGDGYDLIRRESKRIDADATKGGALYPLLRDVTRFQLQFYDFEREEWLDEWDTTNATAQVDHLPPFVRIQIGVRDGEEERVLSTIVKVPLTAPIMEVQ